MSSLETWSDGQLLAGTPRDPAAFVVFYRRHECAVLGFFRYATRSSELAADLTAETFAAALESIGGYRSELGEARAWLFGIARHVLARSLERGRVENRARAALAPPVLVVDDEAIERIEAISANGTVTALLAELPPEVRAAVEGRIVDERAYTELAERLEQQLVSAAGGTAGIREAPVRRVRGWMALAVGAAAVCVVVVVFALVGSNRRHTTATGHAHVTALDPRVPATYAQACAATFDCLTVPPGQVPTALRRPFHPPRLRAGVRCPTTAGTSFMNSYFGGVGLGTAPVRPDIGNAGDLTHGKIVLGTTEDAGWFAIKTVWYSLPSYHGPWSVRAARLNGSGPIDLGSEPAPRPKPGGSPFSPVAVGAAPGDTINTGDGYRTDPRTTWISAPGCYAFQVDGLGFSELIVFQAEPHGR